MLENPINEKNYFALLAKYLMSDHFKLLKAVKLDSVSHLCECCGQPEKQIDTLIVEPIRNKPIDDNIENLEAICTKCHFDRAKEMRKSLCESIKNLTYP